LYAKHLTMKTIMLATDFSDAAAGACTYGFKLADCLNARVILFNAYHTISPAGFDTPVFLDNRDVKQDVEGRLAEQIRSLNVTQRQDVYLDSFEGPVVNTLLRKIKESKADLVVLGMKQAYKKLRKIVGSTITGLLNELPIPMIVVPEGVVFQNISNITVAVKDDVGQEVNLRQTEILNDIAFHFNSNVLIIKVSPNKTQEAFALLHRPYRVSKLLGSTNPVFESVSNPDTEEGVLKFVQSNHIDLLGLFPQDHSMLESLSHASFTKRMIFDAKLPLLIFPKH
jgi:nucleotide-binding universal stress UspA family protein